MGVLASHSPAAVCSASVSQSPVVEGEGMTSLHPLSQGMCREGTQAFCSPVPCCIALPVPRRALEQPGQALPRCQRLLVHDLSSGAVISRLQV